MGRELEMTRIVEQVAIAMASEVNTGFCAVRGVWITEEPVARHAIWGEFGMPFVIATIAGIDRALAMYQGDPITFRFLPAGVHISEYIEALKSVLGFDRRTLVCPDRDDSKSVAQILRTMTVQGGGLTSGLLGTPVGDKMCDQGARADISFEIRVRIWRHGSGVNPNHPITYGREMISTAGVLAIGVDRQNLKNSTCGDHLFRRLMLIDKAVLENPSAPKFEVARHFIAPSLVAYVAKAVGAEVPIAK